MIEPLNKDPFALDDSPAGAGRRWLPWALAVLLVALLAGAWYLWQSMPGPGTRSAVSIAPKPGLPPPVSGPAAAGPAGSGAGATSSAGGAGNTSSAGGTGGTPGTAPGMAPGAGMGAGMGAATGMAPGGTAASGAGLPSVAGSQAGTPGSSGPGGPGLPPSGSDPTMSGSAQGMPGLGTQTQASGSSGVDMASTPPGAAGSSGPSSPTAGDATAPAGPPRYPIERSLSGTGPIDPGTATLDPPAADKAISNALSTLPGRDQILRFALPSEVVRRAVLTIDNLPGDTMSMQYRAVNATGGPLRIERRGQAIVLGAANAGRYDEFVRMASSIDSRRLVGLYKRFYPLFQQEYTSIGYPDRHFNDRVVEAIDDMLATPIIEDPIELIQPRVLYEYADPGLERRSVGQRILLRMGPEHAKKLKAKLREIRTALTNENR